MICFFADLFQLGVDIGISYICRIDPDLQSMQTLLEHKIGSTDLQVVWDNE